MKIQITTGSTKTRISLMIAAAITAIVCGAISLGAEAQPQGAGAIVWVGAALTAIALLTALTGTGRARTSVASDRTTGGKPGPCPDPARQLDTLRRALDHHAIVSTTDGTGTIVDVNAEFCRISGYTREEPLGAQSPHHQLRRAPQGVLGRYVADACGRKP